MCLLFLVSVCYRCSSILHKGHDAGFAAAWLLSTRCKSTVADVGLKFWKPTTPGMGRLADAALGIAVLASNLAMSIHHCPANDSAFMTETSCVHVAWCELLSIRFFVIVYIALQWQVNTSHHITSHRIASHRIASHRIASHRIASHHITLHYKPL